MAYTAGSPKDTANLTADRRTYDIKLGDKIHELWKPSMVPFFTFTTKLRKIPTGDPKPTKLVHKSGWADRRFFAAGAGTWSSGEIANLAVDNGSGGAVGFLIKNLMLRIKHAAGGNTTAIIKNVDSQTQIDLVAVSSSPTNVANNDQIQVIGTAFARGSDKATATYDTVTTEYSYTQIFKTVVDVTGTLAATESFGGSEYERLLADKRYEHLTDIERAILFGERGATTVGSDTVYTTYGIVPYIENNSSISTVKVPSYSSYTFDDFVDDMEDWFTKGGNQATNEKLCLAGSSVIAFFSKIGTGSLWSDAQVQIQHGETEWGVHVDTVKHPFGVLHLVHEPLFRGNSTYAFFKDYMVGVDLENVELKPLKGNGIDRDTRLVKNLQTSEDKYIDEYRTELALLPFLAETHALFKFS
ncbi:MAG: SU10 major capsid protein [Candidatus Njordarchaeia archaeon]